MYRLFLVSSKIGTELLSDTCTRTTVINFSATLEGYQDQLLSATIHIVCRRTLTCDFVNARLYL